VIGPNGGVPCWQQIGIAIPMPIVTGMSGIEVAVVLSQANSTCLSVSYAHVGDRLLRGSLSWGL